MALQVGSRTGLSLLFFVSLTAGCSDCDEVELARVTGTVTRGGHPVPQLLVHFVPEHGRPSWGLTDGKGRFKLYYAENEDGARLGEHRVFVEFNSSQPQSFAGAGPVAKSTGSDMHAMLDEDATAGQPVEQSPALTPEERRAIIDKFGDQDKTPLRVKIERGGHDLKITLD